MLRKSFTEDQVALLSGEAEIAIAFSRRPFDHMLFKGSMPIAKLVMRAAAKNLTPVTRELGGIGPPAWAITTRQLGIQKWIVKWLTS